MSEVQRDLDTVECALVGALGLLDELHRRGMVYPSQMSRCGMQVDELEQAHEALVNVKQQLGLATGLLTAQKG